MRNLILLMSCALAVLTIGCAKKEKEAVGEKPGGLPPNVIVSPVTQKTVPIYGEYVGQTQSVKTVEIRSQVTGFLQRTTFREGSLVHKGDLLFVIDPRPFQAALNQAKANLAQHEATLGKARQDVARYKPLVEQEAISKEQYDTAVAQAEQEAANVAAARAQVTQARLNLNYTKIRAPVTGRIGQANVNIGSLIQAGTTLLDTIYSVDPMYVTFSVSEESYLEYEKRGMQRHRTAGPMELILADGSVYPYKGEFDMVSPQVNPATGTLTIRAIFPNPDGLLKPGLFVRVRYIVREKNNALLVPQQAVQETQGVRSVLVVGRDNKVEMRTIKTDGTVDNMQVVDSGLRPGERVITEGIQKVKPGMTVTPQAARPQQSGTGPAAGK